MPRLPLDRLNPLGMVAKTAIGLIGTGLRGAALDASLRKLFPQVARDLIRLTRQAVRQSSRVASLFNTRATGGRLRTADIPILKGANWTVAGKPRYQYWFKFVLTDKQTGKTQEYFHIYSSRRMLSQEEIDGYLALRKNEFSLRYRFGGRGGRTGRVGESTGEMIGVFRRY